jgi:peptidoglycan/LPS O-acetylase OafA/YrhL
MGRFAVSGTHNRNVSLDTLRALAIALVVFCHATLSYGTPNPLDFMGLGGVGVDLFFCLSGWLLGRLLCEEFKRTGTIDVRRFWLRRWMRTLPAYFAVLAVTVAQSLIQHKMPAWWQYTVFLQNYVGMPFFGVSWSLCVEEYFYLIIAPLLLLCLRRPRFRLLVPPLLVIPLLCRIAAPSVDARWGWSWNLQMTHMRYDQCAAGVLLAVVYTYTPRVWGALCRGLVVLVPLGLYLAGLNFWWRIWRSGHADWDPLVWTFAFGSLVVLANSSDFWRKRARIPGAAYLANRAYSVYLLHVEGIAAMNHLWGTSAGHARAPLWLYIAGVWCVALIGAEVLYRLVERPVMDAREALAASRSSRAVAGATNARSEQVPIAPVS